MDKKYLLLFNTVTDIIDQLDTMKNRLILIQQEAEEIYILEKGEESRIENAL